MSSYRLSTVGALPAEWQVLIAAAIRARERAYAPYSRFPVGAAILTRSGGTFRGVQRRECLDGSHRVCGARGHLEGRLRG